MKKKIVKTIILMIILGLSLLTGCGNDMKDLKEKNADVNPLVSDSSIINHEEELDKYQTAEIPEGKPSPVEPQKTDVNKKEIYTCTISITCSTILDNMDKFDQSKLEVLPEKGIISAVEEVEFYEGESVFDVLLRATKDKGIHMEFVSTPIYNSNYIEGINNIYEFDCGELSGWMYKVNDWFPNYGSSRYQLKNKDKIEWVYTCDLGRDIGGDWSMQNSEREQ